MRRSVDASFFAPGATPKLLALLADRARRLANDLPEEFDSAEQAGASFDDALNSVAVTAYKAAECHGVSVMAKNNAAALDKYIEHAGIREAMQRLFELMVLQQVLESAGDWVDPLFRNLCGNATLASRHC